jgi:hypothetical protein
MLRRTSMLTGVLFVLALLLTAFVPGTASAQGQRCFSETNQCISGPIRAYWEQNGGLPIFGFPITAQRAETVENLTLQVQWFERDRLEIQADGSVTTGRLGVELLARQGRPWQPGNKIAPDSGCIAGFPTGHQVCGEFAKFWYANGDIVRLGYPITPAMQETIEGQTYTVQYFERRRFEQHGNQVLLGLLGREVRDIIDSVPPPDPCDQIPESVFAYVEPNCAPAGTTFAAIGGGFNPGEQIGVYVTAPNQSVIGAPFQVQADNEGISEPAYFTTSTGTTPGIYAFSFEGIESGHKAIAYFRIR